MVILYLQKNTAMENILAILSLQRNLLWSTIMNLMVGNLILTLGIVVFMRIKPIRRNTVHPFVNIMFGLKMLMVIQFMLMVIGVLNIRMVRFTVIFKNPRRNRKNMLMMMFSMCLQAGLHHYPIKIAWPVKLRLFLATSINMQCDLKIMMAQRLKSMARKSCSTWREHRLAL